ncbi:hypothetical protein M4D81_25060 [Paenibacillus sp. p3-SID867]|uniref:hypothetical protein n=1 Tax=Paenibacillus sp. p3-SID867 TaxID=2916363 RepID=UPI0021A700FD|nr:hypothetical protein [Paenibacillus sp. p3-SID867]MCT1402272.1 hypothetical protein [Paenibacillus sp. p3-SID867]
MTKSTSSKLLMFLSAAAVAILFGFMFNTEGSALKDAMQEGLMGAVAVIAVAGLWAAGAKK